MGAEYLYLPPSGDALVNIEATMGIAKVFHVLGMGDRWTMSSRCFDGANYGLFTGNDAHMKADQQAVRRGGQATRRQGAADGRVRPRLSHHEAHDGAGHVVGRSCPSRSSTAWSGPPTIIRAGKLQFDKSKNPQPVTYHDPCNFAKSCGIVEAPRVILRAACADFREMTPHGAENWCCGGGGGLSAMNEIREFRMTVSGAKKRSNGALAYEAVTRELLKGDGMKVSA